MKSPSTCWIYQRTESQLWTTGFFDPDGHWHADCDYDDSEAAAKRCAYLNGCWPEGPDQIQQLAERVDRLERTAHQAANTASCLANGIQPD